MPPLTYGRLGSVFILEGHLPSYDPLVLPARRGRECGVGEQFDSTSHTSLPYLSPKRKALCVSGPTALCGFRTVTYIRILRGVRCFLYC